MDTAALTAALLAGHGQPPDSQGFTAGVWEKGIQCSPRIEWSGSPDGPGSSGDVTMKLMALTVMFLTPFTNSEPSSAAAADTRERVLADFSDKVSVRSWRAVNDDVMGGVSKGGPGFEDGRLVFSGETRLENNGGFSSIRSNRRDWKLGGARDIVLRLRGTASRKYTMLLETPARHWGRRVSYRQSFELDGDGWQTISLPLADFSPMFRGRNLRGPKLDDERIRSLGFMVYDKKAGPFRLEIDWIKASWPEEASSDEPSQDGKNIVALASSAGKFGTLLKAATEAGLAETLTGKGPFTVLAPTDEAFSALSEGTLESLLEPGSRDKLRLILLYHVIPGTLSASELAVAGTASTAQGQDVTFALTNGRLTANGANILLNDLQASNGVVHAIDRVLLPKPESTPAQRILETAVRKGVPLFNDGHVDACAAIYEVAMTAILELDAPGLDQHSRNLLSTALESARKDENRRSAAWTMRRAIDAAWSRLSD